MIVIIFFFIISRKSLGDTTKAFVAITYNKNNIIL